MRVLDSVQDTARIKALVVIAVVVVVVAVSGVSPTASRQKRYLHFPYGSTLRVGIATKWSTIFDQRSTPTFWTEGFNWGISYDLPNGTQLQGPSGLASRRDRRDLYRRLETAIDSSGLLGKSCLLRAICEAPKALAPGDNLVAELVRIVLLSPLTGGENPSHYDLAQQSGVKGEHCSALYRDCPVSVLSLLLSLRPE